jgi:hypothetical protein|tara:strand:+ start:428 stop:598 length:171 start_codon:yes stop_codon:yes gene_type:complete
MLVLIEDNVKWLGVACKYLENQYDTSKDDYTKELLTSGDNKDKVFEKELDFIITLL